MAHSCHADKCTTEVPPRMHMCRKHWRMVPRRLQDALWAAYEPGQERRKDPSAEYLVAAERCICAVAMKEGLITQEEADARIAVWEDQAEDLAELFPRLFGETEEDDDVTATN